MSRILEVLPYLGWAGMALTLISTFSRTMIPLRGFAAASNIFAIVAAGAAGYWPNMAQNAVQLPLNLYRLRQMTRLIADISGVPETNVNEDWLTPFADSRDLTAGTVLFRKGDKGDRLYYLATGRVRFPEIDVEIGEGTLFGELAFFTRDGKRTQTALCMTDSRVLSVGEDELKQLYFQNPQFGWYLVQLIAERLMENAERAQKQAS